MDGNRVPAFFHFYRFNAKDHLMLLPQDERPTKRCGKCEKFFAFRRETQRFCSNKCRMGWHREQTELKIKNLEDQVYLQKNEILRLKEELKELKRA